MLIQTDNQVAKYYINKQGGMGLYLLFWEANRFVPLLTEWN